MMTEGKEKLSNGCNANGPYVMKKQSKHIPALGRIGQEDFSTGCDTGAGLTGQNIFGGPCSLGHSRWKGVSGKKEHTDQGGNRVAIHSTVEGRKTCGLRDAGGTHWAGDWLSCLCYSISSWAHLGYIYIYISLLSCFLFVICIFVRALSLCILAIIYLSHFK